MKSFRFKYTVTVWILLVLVAIISAVGLGWNIFSATEYAGVNTLKTITSIIMAVLCAFLTVLVLGAIFYGKYKIKGQKLITCIGFLTTKTDLETVVQIVHFTKSNKLVAYDKNDKFFVIVIAPQEYDDFVLSVRNQNPKIAFGKKIDGEDTPV